VRRGTAYTLRMSTAGFGPPAAAARRWTVWPARAGSSMYQHGRGGPWTSENGAGWLSWRREVAGGARSATVGALCACDSARCIDGSPRLSRLLARGERDNTAVATPHESDTASRILPCGRGGQATPSAEPLTRSPRLPSTVRTTAAVVAASRRQPLVRRAGTTVRSFTLAVFLVPFCSCL